MKVKHFFGILIYLLQSIQFSWQQCSKRDQCSCRFPNGSEVALHQIDKGNEIAFKDITEGTTSYLTDYNPCTPFNEGDKCHDVLACQKVGKVYYPMANPDTPTFIVRGDGNINMQYSAVSGGVTRTFIVKLICDMEATTPRYNSIVEKPPDTYTFELTHKCACAGACSSGDAPSDSGKNLSTGSLLCILLLVLVVVYLVGGVLFLKFYKKEEGVDVIPNREFWMDFPAKVKDGFKFTWGKIGKNDKEYESI